MQCLQGRVGRSGGRGLATINRRHLLADTVGLPLRDFLVLRGLVGDLILVAEGDGAGGEAVGTVAHHRSPFGRVRDIGGIIGQIAMQTWGGDLVQ